MTTRHAQDFDPDIRTNILLVDDRPQNLLTLQAVLEPLGQNLILAQSGEQALKSLLGTDFAVILLDVLMPGLDGFETATLIKERARTRHVPIIFLTAASPPEEHVSRGYTIGAVDYISKPFSPDVLRAKVAVFVELYRKNEQIRRQSELLRLNEQREREREREELRRLSEKHYEELAESMPQIVFTATPDGHIKYFNRRWHEYAAPVQGATSVGEWKDVIHPDDLPGLKEAWGRAHRDATNLETALRFRHAADGGYRWHLVRALPTRDSRGKVTEWIGTSTEIDDRVRAEKGLQLLADASKLLATSLDWQGILPSIAELAVANMADWCAITLCESDGSVRCLALVHPHTGEATAPHEMGQGPEPGDEPWCQIRLHDEDPSRLVESITDETIASHARDGEHLRRLRALGIRSWIFVPLYDTGATIGSIQLATGASGRHYRPSDLAVVEDLARRVSAAIVIARLYETAQRKRAELEDASRAKDEFFAILSHELRTPLHVILGWTQLLRSGKLDAETSAQALETIERSGKAQTRLIKDILDVSRVITGKLQIQIGSVDLGEVVRLALDSLRPAAELKEIRVDLLMDSGAVPIVGDTERLEQVAWNLISNAIKFTPRGGSITIDLAPTDDSVVLSVRDSGIGISRDFLPFVFDRFRQEDSSTARAYGGLGLGLSIVKHLVELHGGRVHAESEGPGRGTCMRVELPYSRGRLAIAQPGLEQIAESVYLYPELDGLSVFVIEDSAEVRALLRAILESAGMRVRTSESARDALRAIRREWPDVLISDIGLPGQDGYDLMREIRSLEQAGHRAQTPAIALTAYAADVDKRRASEAGFQVHLAKPLDRDALLCTISRLVVEKKVKRSTAGAHTPR